MSVESIRFASFNASLNRSSEGGLIESLSTPDDTQAQAVAEIIQRVNPDVLLVNEFDFDPNGEALELFQENYLSVSQAEGVDPVEYPFTYIAPSNTGIPSGVDFNGDGEVGGPNDAFGFGFFPGQFGMAVYSKFPIAEDGIRTFQEFLWKDMPGGFLSDDPTEDNPDTDVNENLGSFFSEEAIEVFRLSSKSHWDIPVDVNGEIVHFLTSHPTPPVFDGPEDLNGKRNFDEIRFWSDYVTPGASDYIYDDEGNIGGLAAGARFVIAGDQNSDPFDGDSFPGAAQLLLENPLVNGSTTDPAITPSSAGGPDASDRQGEINAEHQGNPAFDTADFADGAPGNLRVDYVLPSNNLALTDTGVFWPADEDPLFELVGDFDPEIGGFPSSDHRLVFADLAIADQNLNRVTSAQFLGEVTFPTGELFQETEIGGLSGLAYDAEAGIYYALSDDRGSPRFYTLGIDISDGSLDDGDVAFTAVTSLLDENGDPFAPGVTDPEGIALSSDGTLYIASEGDANQLINPFVNEFQLGGQQIGELPVDDKFFPVATLSSSADGTQVVPPNGSTATATAQFTLTDAGLEYFIDIEGLDLLADPGDRIANDTVDKIHLHLGPVGENGPHVLNIFGLPSEDDADLVVDFENETLSGIWDDSDATDLNGDGDFDDENETKPLSEFRDELLNGEIYLQVHTPEFPDSAAIRGQVELDGLSGIRNNLAFESATISPDGTTLYTATENALFQDGPAATTELESPSRIVQYDLTTGEAVAEFAYFTDPVAAEPIPADQFSTNGLVELLAIDNAGTLLALERSFSVGVGNGVKLYEVNLQGTTDISGFDGILNPESGEPFDIDAVAEKRLLVDFGALGITLDNLEALALGPVLPDGRQSLVVASDNNFNDTQFTQFLAFALELDTVDAVTPAVETPALLRFEDPENPDPEAELFDSDDPAIYVHPDDPNQSFIVMSLKNGGYAVYDLDGQTIELVTPDNIRYNNVDLVYGFQLGQESADLAVFSDRRNDTLAIYRIDPASGQLTNITGDVPETIFGVDDGEATAYGLATYTSIVDGSVYAFTTQADGNLVAQLELTDGGDGSVGASVVRTLELPVPTGDPEDSQSEGIVIDRELGVGYVALEDQVGILKFSAEPDGGDELTTIQPINSSPDLVQTGFDELIVFGDSTVDTGNTFLGTGGTTPPSPPYFNGRFSNGPLAIELFADDLGLEVAPFLDGGTNYAIGGAPLGEGEFAVGAQIESYAAAGNMPSADDLFFISAGSNDFFDNPESDPATVVSSLSAHVTMLAGLGAENIAVANLPTLGDLPEQLAGENSDLLNEASIEYNTLLAAELATLETALGIEIYPVDIFTGFELARTNPELVGFTNVTDPALNEETGEVVANPNEFLFWDDTHLSAAAQVLLSEVVSMSIPDGAAGVFAQENVSPLVADIEGLTLYYGEDGEGYLIASSQGDNTYSIFTRDEPQEFLGNFTIGEGNGVDSAEESDGLDIINVALGDRFPFGLLAVQDGSSEPQVVFQDPEDGEIQNFTTNFKYVSLDELSDVLDLDPTGFDPRAPQANSLVNGIASGDTSQTTTVLWARSTVPGDVTFEYFTGDEFTATLDSAQEVPTNDSQATGVATLELNEAGTALSYSITVTGVDFGPIAGVEPLTEDTGDDVTLLHFHAGEVGTNGPVVFGIFGPNQDDDDLSIVLNDDGSAVVSGIWEENDPANSPLSAQLDNLLGSGLYFNLHTEEFPGGEIRGQITPVLANSTADAFFANLDNVQEVPTNDSQATGVATIALNEAGTALSYSVEFTGLDFGPIAGAEPLTEDTGDDAIGFHFHAGAVGENGPVVFGIFGPNQDDDLSIVLNDDGSAVVSGIWEETDSANSPLSEQLETLLSGGLYLNLHTEEFPGGEIRGQVLPVPPGSITATVTDTDVPAKVLVEGLTPGTEYFYEVTDAAGDSELGRFETAAADDTRAGLRFGVSGDWRGELAPYPAIANVPERELAFFVEHGDTIYADDDSPALLNPDGTRNPQAETLDEFRAKHAEVYGSRFGSNDWAELRASTSIFATIDDHEVTNDFAGGATADTDPRFPETEGFINDTQLFENGMQAFQEYNPIEDRFYGETGDELTANERELYRFQTYGDDAAAIVLDNRSFRDIQVAGVADPTNVEDVARFQIDAFEPGRTMLGAEQLDDLKQDLQAAQDAGVTWKFVMVPEPIQELGLNNADSFEGYLAERTEILSFIETNGIENVVFVAADIHGTFVNNLTYQTEPFGDRIPTGAFEITTGAVAYDPPFGEAVIEVAASLLTPEELAFYNSLPVAPDLDDIVNDKDDFLAQAFSDLSITPNGLDPIGLDDNLPQVDADGRIDATLLQGDYVAAHTYGWTEFTIAEDTQQLTVTTYGIESYDEAELLADPDAILAREPQIVSQFQLNPVGFEGEPDSDLVAGGAGDDSLDDRDFDGGSDIIFAGAGGDSIDTSLGFGGNRVFAGSGADEMFAGEGDRLSGGEGDDIFDSSIGRGDNRLAGDAGDDFFFLGRSDRAIGGEGDDSFFVLSGGNNTLTGGPGADLFSLANAQLPEAANTVTDFTNGEDTIGISGLVTGFDDPALAIALDNGDTTIAIGGVEIARLLGVDANSLDAGDFTFG